MTYPIGKNYESQNWYYLDQYGGASDPSPRSEEYFGEATDEYFSSPEEPGLRPSEVDPDEIGSWFVEGEGEGGWGDDGVSADFPPTSDEEEATASKKDLEKQLSGLGDSIEELYSEGYINQKIYDELLGKFSRLSETLSLLKASDAEGLHDLGTMLESLKTDIRLAKNDFIQNGPPEDNGLEPGKLEKTSWATSFEGLIGKMLYVSEVEYVKAKTEGDTHTNEHWIVTYSDGSVEETYSQPGAYTVKYGSEYFINTLNGPTVDASVAKDVTTALQDLAAALKSGKWDQVVADLQSWMSNKAVKVNDRARILASAILIELGEEKAGTFFKAAPQEFRDALKTALAAAKEETNLHSYQETIGLMGGEKVDSYTGKGSLKSNDSHQQVIDFIEDCEKEIEDEAPASEDESDLDLEE